MPTKTTKDDAKRYVVNDKQFVWTTDEGAEVIIPLRIKLKVIRSLAAEGEMDATVMFRMLEQLIPDQAETLDEMDVNDFVGCFTAWQSEYNLLSGASLGESPR